MAIPTVEQLIEQIGQIRETPSIPREASEGMTLHELCRTMAGTRAALIEAVSAAPDSAFEEQPADAEGEQVWGAGQILGHCNSALFNIGSSALGLVDVEPGEAPEPLSRWSEVRTMSRDEAQQAAGAADVEAFFGRIPPGADLEAANQTDFFGPMPARAWLYFMALHEADHVAQVRALSG